MNDADRHRAIGQYSWDERKDARNRSKHGVAFETAALVFDDPLLVTSPPESLNGEVRWQTVGMAGPDLMLIVAYTVREDRIHIISARRVTKPERRLFETFKSERSKQVLGHAVEPGGRGWFGERGYRDERARRRAKRKDE